MKPSPPVRVLQNIVATAFLVVVLLGFVGWLSFVISGSIPQPVIAVGCYAVVTAEVGARMLARLQRLRLF